MDFVIKAEWDDGWSVGPAEPPLSLTRVNLLTLTELSSANQSVLDSGGKHVYSLHRYPEILLRLDVNWTGSEINQEITASLI